MSRIVYSLLCDASVEILRRYLRIRLASKRGSDTQKVRLVTAPNTWKKFNPGPQFYRNLTRSSGAGISAPRGHESEQLSPTQEGRRTCGGACRPRSPTGKVRFFLGNLMMSLPRAVSKASHERGFDYNFNICGTCKDIRVAKRNSFC
jgi:hypothetical protein